MKSIEYTVDIKQATTLTEDALASGLVPFLHSAPGCGKSSIIKAIAKKNNLKLIDLRLSTIDSVDLSGMPMIKENHQVDWVPFDVFPLTKTPVPQGYNGWLLFLDEFNSASEPVIAAAYNVVLDHRIGIYNLNPKCFIACAGNREEDHAITTSIGTAMTSRLVHLTLEPTVDAWINQVAIPQHYDYRVIAFLSMHPDAFNDFDPSKPTDTYACPRTWEFLNRELEVFKAADPTLKNLSDKLPLLAGTVSAGIAVEFVQFCKVIQNLPTYENIVKSPLKAKLPDDLSALWATVSMCAQKVSEDDIDVVSEYIRRIPDRSMQGLFTRAVIQNNPLLVSNQNIASFVTDLAIEIGEMNDALHNAA